MSTRTIVRFSSNSYYDAAGESRDRDWFWGCVESDDDAMFDAWVRRTTLARSRREARNNPWFLGLVESFPNLIGATNLRSMTKDKAYNLVKELWWFRWSKHCEVTGLSLDEVNDIVWKELLLAGEIFVILLNSGKIQLVQSEHCTKIDYTPTGLPKSYTFVAAKDGVFSAEGEGTTVDARNVIHIYRQDRVRQGRGLPWLIASLVPARDLAEIDSSKTKQIKDANQLFGILKRNAQNALKPLDGFSSFGSAPGAPASPETEDAAADKPAESRVIELKNGTVVALESGEDIDLKRPEYQTTDHREFIMLKLHAMSTPLGIPVELWYSGLGDVSYSGFKGLGAQWNGRRVRHAEWFETAFLDRLQFWRVSKAAKEGDLPPNPDGNDDAISWGWKRTSVLDEEREAKAVMMRIDSGMSDIAHELERDGRFVEEVFAQRRETWIKMLEASGRLPEGGDTSKVVVPAEFLLRGQLPDKNWNLWTIDGQPADDAAGAAREKAKAV